VDGGATSTTTNSHRNLASRLHDVAIGAAAQIGAKKKLFTRNERKRLSEVEIEQVPLQIKVHQDGSFTARIFLNDSGTFKNVQVSTKTTVADLKQVLIDKLNLSMDAEHYALVERKAGKGRNLRCHKVDLLLTIYRHTYKYENKERFVDANDVLFTMMSAWSVQDILMFRKRDSALAGEQDADTVRANRRVAKVANMLGVIDSKKMVGTNDNMELKLLADRLSKSTSASSKVNTFQIDHIVKDGWLQMRTIQGKTDQYWCSIENENFVGINKSKSKANADTVNLTLRGLDISAPEETKCAFTIKHKYGELTFLCDSEEGRDTWVQVLRKCASKQTKQNLEDADLEGDTEFNKKIKKRTNGVTIEDFELKAVLGRGKFGKVEIDCEQLVHFF
jgi:hypothetical protein